MRNVSIRELAVHVIWACVAALLTTGCAVGGETTPEEPLPLPAFTEQSPEGYDFWDEARGAETTTHLVKLGNLVDIKSLRYPTDEDLRKGFWAVGLLEEYCVVQLANPVGEERFDAGITNLVISSRYNMVYYYLVPGVPSSELKATLDRYRGMCLGETTPPEMEPLSI